MKKMKKFAAIFMIMILALSSAACGSTEGGSSAGNVEKMSYEEWMEQDPAIIGVCFAQINTEYNTYKEYLENYIGPKYNLKFIFSEAVSDVAGEISFLENCSAQGAVGFIDFCGNDIEQISQRCEDLGIYLMFQYVLDEDQKDLLSGEYFLGTANSDSAIIGEKYGEALTKIAGNGELEGVLLTTAVAAKGNVQHIETGLNVLDGIASMADLTYTEDEYDIVTSSSAMEVENSANLPIYVYPGTVANTEGYLAGLSAQLMTGKYNVVISSTTAYSQMLTVIDEAERALGKDIKLISVASLGSDLEHAMTTQDSFGNLTLDAAIIKPGTWVIGGLVVPLLNQLTGYGDACVDGDGNHAEYIAGAFLVTSTEEMQQINTKDIAEDSSWILQTSDMEEMLGMYHPEITLEEILTYYGQDMDSLF